MGTVVVVGKIEDPAAEAAALAIAKELAPLPKDWLGRVKKAEVPWLNCPVAARVIDCLNIASVALFLRHVAELEGVQVERRINNTKWPNLPDYEQTYWLPLELPRPEVVTPQGGYPLAVGSAQVLLRELDQIRQISPYSLGTRPRHFGSDFEGTLSDVETLQWVWLALHQGATEAVAQGAPVSIG